jgi:hypothetical protein
VRNSNETRPAFTPVIFCPRSDDEEQMGAWSDDVSACSLEELLQTQSENRAWSQDLRRKSNLLVNSRLANQISLEDYAADRKISQEEALECRRRAALLDKQIVRRKIYSLSRES